MPGCRTQTRANFLVPCSPVKAHHSAPHKHEYNKNNSSAKYAIAILLKRRRFWQLVNSTRQELLTASDAAKIFLVNTFNGIVTVPHSALFWQYCNLQQSRLAVD